MGRTPRAHWRALVSILAGVALVPLLGLVQSDSKRFSALDIYLDVPLPIAAYQVEITGSSFILVGVGLALFTA